MWLLKYNRELKKGLGGLYEFVLRLLKGLYLVFFRGDSDKILQRNLEMMQVYLSDRALHGHVMLGHSRNKLGNRRALTICMENPEIPERIHMQRFIAVEIFSGKK